VSVNPISICSSRCDRRRLEHMSLPTVVIAEDEPQLRAELRETLSKLWPELVICADAADGAWPCAG
jgi:hypothetical protein